MSIKSLTTQKIRNRKKNYRHEQTDHVNTILRLIPKRACVEHDASI